MVTAQPRILRIAGEQKQTMQVAPESNQGPDAPGVSTPLSSPTGSVVGPELPAGGLVLPTFTTWVANLSRESMGGFYTLSDAMAQEGGQVDWTG